MSVDHPSNIEREEFYRRFDLYMQGKLSYQELHPPKSTVQSVEPKPSKDFPLVLHIIFGLIFIVLVAALFFGTIFWVGR